MKIIISIPLNLWIVFVRSVGVVTRGYILPPDDLFEMAKEILLMFLWRLAPVVADVTLGVLPHFWFSNVLRSCGMLGNLTPSRERDVG